MLVVPDRFRWLRMSRAAAAKAPAPWFELLQARTGSAFAAFQQVACHLAAIVNDLRTNTVKLDDEISRVPALQGGIEKSVCVTKGLHNCNWCDALSTNVMHSRAYPDAAAGEVTGAAVGCPSLLSSHCIISVTLRSEPLPF